MFIDWLFASFDSFVLYSFLCLSFSNFLNCRRREQQLAKEHQNEVDELTADHLRETQKILAEFNRAKELLKDKIEALQLL